MVYPCPKKWCKVLIFIKNKIVLSDYNPTIRRCKNYLKTFLYSLFLFAISLGITYFLCPFTAKIFCYIGGPRECSGGFSSIDFSPVIGILLNYLFFIPLLFIVFGDKNKYWWIGVTQFLMFLFLIRVFYSPVYFLAGIFNLLPFILSIFLGVALGLIIVKIKNIVLKNKMKSTVKK